jgi:hypothetical protein
MPHTHKMAKIGQLSDNRYKERVALIKYSLTFSGAAAAFLISISTKQDSLLHLKDIKFILLIWGVTIISGFLQYVLSYREVYYHRHLMSGLRKQIIPRVELFLLYIMMFVHPFAMLIGLIMTSIFLWSAFS